MATNYEFWTKLINNLNDECTRFDSKWIQRHGVLDATLSIIARLLPKVRSNRSNSRISHKPRCSWNCYGKSNICNVLDVS